MKNDLIIKMWLLLMPFNNTVLSQTAPKMLWEKSFDHNRYERFTSIKQTSDSGIICIGTTEDTTGIDNYIVKTDKDGNSIWQYSSQTDTATEYGMDIIEIDNSELLAVGGYEKHGIFEDMDVVITKFTSTGIPKWSKYYDLSNNIELLYSIINTYDGNFLIAAYGMNGVLNSDIWFLKINSVGDIIWSRVYDLGSNSEYPSELIQTTDLGFICF